MSTLEAVAEILREASSRELKAPQIATPVGFRLPATRAVEHPVGRTT